MVAENLCVEEIRCELVEGEERQMGRPSANHSTVALNLAGIIRSYLRGKKRCKLLSEVDVHLDEKNLFVPDLVVVCDAAKIRYDGIYGAPDLVIEILSPSTAKLDRGVKKATYEKYGVREYWLVNPKDRSIEVYRLRDEKFVLNDIYHDYDDMEWSMLTEREKAVQPLKLKVSLYDDLEINVAEVFEDML